MQSQIKIVKINSWGNETLYHAIGCSKISIPFTVTNIRDRKGNLKRVECSITDDFEVYTMTEVKKVLQSQWDKIYGNVKTTI